MSEREVDPALQAEVRAAISDAYYDARNDGQTMEFAADQATIKVIEIIKSVDANAHARGAAEERDERRKQDDEIRRDRAREWYT